MTSFSQRVESCTAEKSCVAVGKLRAPAKVLRITIIDRGDYTSYIMLLAFIPNVTLQRGEPDHRENPQWCRLFISRVEQQSVAFARP